MRRKKPVYASEVTHTCEHRIEHKVKGDAYNDYRACGKPARYVFTNTTNAKKYLCGWHARKHKDDPGLVMIAEPMKRLYDWSAYYRDYRARLKWKKKEMEKEERRKCQKEKNAKRRRRGKVK